MRTLVDQLEQSLQARLYYLSLLAALAIPDIAGALDSDDGRANGERYAQWFEVWVRPVFGEAMAATLRARLPPEVLASLPAMNEPMNPLTGQACYHFRCSMLHQGSSQNPNGQFARIIFVEPGASTGTVHASVANDALIIDLPMFCQEVIRGTRRWLDSVQGSPKFEANYERFARRHPEGLPPYIGGVPVIG
jgi:hypothetical protein